MAERPKKPREAKPSDGERFIGKLGKAPTFALKEVARALYVVHRGTQAELLDALRSGDLIASVCWPDPTLVVDVPRAFWDGTRTEDFSVREKGAHGWHYSDYQLSRTQLTRHLIVPRLRAIQAQMGDGSQHSGTRGKVSAGGDAEALRDFGQAINDLENGRASAEVFVTPQNVRSFALKYFGSIDHKGPGRPKTEPEMINVALVEAFRRLYKADPRPKQTALCADMLTWWNRQFETRSESFIRNNVLRPIWKALKLSVDA